MSQAIHDDPTELWWKHRLAQVEREAEQLRARIRDLPVAEQNAVAEAIGHALGYTTEQRLVVTPALAFRLAEVAALRHTVTQQQDELRRLEASDAANRCGDLRERAEVAEQEVAHLRDRLERTEALAAKQGAAAQRQGDMLAAVAGALGFGPREDPTADQMVNTAAMLYTAWERHQHTTARLDAERAEAIRLADELDAMAKRLADQTVMIRAQQQVIDHLRRPLKARVVARVARWVRG